MIAKHVAMRAVRKSDFGDLVKYITDSQGSQERVGYVGITNCNSTTPADAADEVRLTQQANTRSKVDKTYHLIVSFREGEEPTADVLRTVEDRFCKALGFAEHQRVSAAHYDTDNVHLHIAINTVHPTRHTVHTPFNAYWTMGQLCGRLEAELGLAADNHESVKLTAENRAQDMERHSGVESLLGWVRNECLDRLTAATTWKDLHDTLHEHGLEMRARGNGIVITDGEGAHVKASTVARALSKAELEKRLGPFQPSQHASDRPLRKKYEKAPVRSRIDTAALHQEFKEDLARMRDARAPEAQALRTRHVAQLEAIKDGNRLRRATIKLIGGGRATKKLLYSAASRALKNELQKAREQHRLERAYLSQQYARQRTWADWLKAQAGQGNAEALAALRAREHRQQLRGATLTAVGTPDAATVIPAPARQQDVLTKKGTLIYHFAGSAVRDDGERLQVSRGADRQGVDAALRLAIHRYGEQIAVTGSDEFKSRVIVEAVRSALPVKFADPSLERRRLALIQLTTKEKDDNQDRRRVVGRRDGDVRGRTADGSEPGAGLVERVGRGRTGGPDGAAIVASRGQPTDGATIDRKPDIGRVGTRPPPQRKNRLRNLSELGVVRLASGTQVLLPRDVPRQLEQQGAQPTHELRRPVSRPGAGGIAEAAAMKYIAEREEKRARNFAISKHAIYTHGAEATLIYAGTRVIDGQPLALFKRDDAVEVLPIDAATAQRLRRASIGGLVTVTAQGSIKTKGRSR